MHRQHESKPGRVTSANRFEHPTNVFPLYSARHQAILEKLETLRPQELPQDLLDPAEVVREIRDQR